MISKVLFCTTCLISVSCLYTIPLPEVKAACQTGCHEATQWVHRTGPEYQYGEFMSRNISRAPVNPFGTSTPLNQTTDRSECDAVPACAWAGTAFSVTNDVELCSLDGTAVLFKCLDD